MASCWKQDSRSAVVGSAPHSDVRKLDALGLLAPHDDRVDLGPRHQDLLRRRPERDRAELDSPLVDPQHRATADDNGQTHHEAGSAHNQADAADYASGKKWWDGTLSKNAVSLQQSLGGRWLTSPEFRLGDVVVFNLTVVHGSLDNQTDRIRLSTDTRYQLAADPVDERWVGDKPPGHVTAMRRGRVC